MDALSALLQAISDVFFIYLVVCFLIAVLIAGATGTMLYLLYSNKRVQK